MNHFVFDTNVVVSALIFNDSAPGQAFVKALEHGTILISRRFVTELRNVLGRSKFDRYITRTERDKFLETLIREAALIDVTKSIRACRDPKDNQILELAVSGDAALIVTGDNDLLVLNPFRGIGIVSPNEFLKLSILSTPF